MSIILQTTFDDQVRCEVLVKGHLDSHWSEWFDGLAISHEQESATWLRGVLPDQAAFYGLLYKIRNLGLVLLSVKIESVSNGNP